jgi:hypothetical protein
MNTLRQKIEDKRQEVFQDNTSAQAALNWRDALNWVLSQLDQEQLGQIEHTSQSIQQPYKSIRQIDDKMKTGEEILDKYFTRLIKEQEEKGAYCLPLDLIKERDEYKVTLEAMREYAKACLERVAENAGITWGELKGGYRFPIVDKSSITDEANLI